MNTFSLFPNRRGRIKGAATIGAFVVLCLLSSGVSAQTTAVLGVGGRGTTGFHNTVTRLLITAVENNADLELVDRHDLSTEDAFGLLGCSEPSPECMSELALTLEVDRILCGSVIGETGDYEIDLRYFDAVHSSYLMEQVSPFQTEDDRTVVELRLAAVVSGRSVLRVVSNRDDVTIRIDDGEQGLAPIVVFDLPGGRYVISATCDQCQEITRIVQITEGRFYTESLDPPIDPSASLGPDDDDTDRSPYILPIVTLSMGGVLLGTGAVFGVMTNSTQEDFDTTPDYDEAVELAESP